MPATELKETHMKSILFVIGCLATCLAVLTTGSVLVAWVVAVIYHTCRLLGVH